MQTSVVGRTLRPHQWLKNALIAVPALAAHRFDEETLTAVFLAIAVFSLCASGGYVLNDLLDADADRHHHRKRKRPFATRELTPGTGALLIAVTWSLGFGVAALFLSATFVLIAAGYVATTAAYSLWLKREPVLDVMILAGFYVIRVVAGGIAASVPVSTWLLTFMLFVSLSLAFLKRFIEVNGSASGVPRRGYDAGDATWLQSAGISSAYLSAVVLAIYANSSDVTRLYGHPERLVLVSPLLVYWATRIWRRAHRQQMHDDPLVGVALDPATYVIAVASGAIVLAAV